VDCYTGEGEAIYPISILYGGIPALVHHLGSCRRKQQPYGGGGDGVGDQISEQMVVDWW
jgi:hypothetical protein